MPHIAGHDASGSGTDYSDFEYQQLQMTPALDEEGNDAFQYLYEFEPLGGIGGLDNNEVAELVYSEIQVSIEFEDEGVNQEVATAAEMRGIFGANLNAGNGLDAISNDLTESTEGGQTALEASDDRVFQMFVARGIAPSDSVNTEVPDTYTASAGGSVDSGVVYEKPWRQLTNRGPVLDSSDSIDFTGNLVVGDQLPGVTSGNIRAHLVWDTAETSDAGRAFSVPS